jgi:RNA polymerase sigma factor (sigma-70 family)
VGETVPTSGHTETELLRAVRGRTADDLGDGQLLEQFLALRDEAAFAALVRRHGPMVLGVCRRLLGNLADADDAFQAVFLVLVRRASSLTGRAVLGDWLHGVARRTALKARSAAWLRRTKERSVARPDAASGGGRNDWLPLLDAELGRLPEKYRLPIVLCDLEGNTRREAAARLGWPEGTVAARLARGRALLAKRVLRGAQCLAGALPLTLPPELVRATTQAATVLAGGGGAAVSSTNAMMLSEDVVRSMFRHKLKTALLVVLAALAFASAGGLAVHAVAGWGRQMPQENEVAHFAPAPKSDEPGEWKPLHVCEGHTAIVMAVALSPDGKVAVSGGDDQTLRFWNTIEGEQIRQFTSRPYVGGIRFSPNGKVVAVAASDSIHFWDPAIAKETGEKIAVKEGPGYGLAYSPDGTKLAVVAGDGVQVWDVRKATRESAFSFEKESVARVWKVAFSPDGTQLAVALHSQGSKDDDIPEVPLVRVLDVKSGKAVFTAWESGTVNAVAFSPDGKTLVAGGMLPEGADEDGVLIGWDLQQKKERFKERADKHGLFCLAYSPDGKTIVTGGTEPAIRLWDGATGKPRGKLEKHTDQVHDLAFSADGKTLASAGRDKLVVIWRLESVRK